MKLRLTLALLAVTTVAVALETSVLRNELKRSVYLATGGGITKANNTRITDFTDIRQTTFMGKGVMLHTAVHAPLLCVEKAIKRECTESYQPKNLSGWRSRNTIMGSEISDHVFGIALDIDPTLNTCCGCVRTWAEVQGCLGWEIHHGPGPYEIPDCWIEQFEAHGFFWFGHEPIRDTMHFSYLAKPGTVACEPGGSWR